MQQEQSQPCLDLIEGGNLWRSSSLSGVAAELKAQDAGLAKKNYKILPWNNALCGEACNYCKATQANNCWNTGLVVHQTQPGVLLIKAWGPLWLGVQSLSRKRLRIAAAITFFCRVWFKRGFRHCSNILARLSFIARRLRTPTCAWMRGRAR